jgi:hypothetical protein
MGVKEKRGVVLVDAMFASAVDELGPSPFMPLRMDGVNRHLGQTSIMRDVPLSFIHRRQILPHNLHDGLRDQGIEIVSDANRLDS